MTTQYLIRDEKGVLVAYIDNKIMAAITTSGGKWRPYNKTVCFEYTEDNKMDFNCMGLPLTIMLWAGYKIIPVN